MKKISIGISSCLLGLRTRYDGGHCLNPYISEKLPKYLHVIALCPESGCGLPTPREPMHLVMYETGPPRLVGIESGINYTKALDQWSQKTLPGLESLCGFILKARSPSCSPSAIAIHNPNGKQIATGPGLFALAFAQMYPLTPIIDEEAFQNQYERENFIRRARNRSQTPL